MLQILLLLNVLGVGDYSWNTEVRSIDEIHVGQCLTMEQIQSHLLVKNPNLYLAGDCEKIYPTADKLKQKLSCEIELEAGDWVRKIQKHDKPGIFWPAAVPCMSSVSELNLQSKGFAEIASGLQCTAENSKLISLQTEALETKRVEIGQGEAYLPSPLTIRREEYAENAIVQCSEEKAWADYGGWGGFTLSWKKDDCLSHKTLSCKNFKAKSAKNSDGKDCLLIKNVEACH